MSSSADQLREEIRREAERVHESAQWASETQFEYAKRWRRVDRWIGGASALLAGIAGVGGLSEVLSARWAGLIAVLAAGTAAVAVSLGAPKTKERAAISANAYRSLQQDARIFLRVDLARLDDDEARRRLSALVERLQQLNAESEIPSGKAWRQAKKNIEAGAQKYEADES
jgi:hypothetical protein